MQLNGSRALVTGGVSGLGLAVARHLTRHGARVALFDVNRDKGAEAVAALGDDKARFFATDVSDEAQVQANVDAAREFLGGLDIRSEEHTSELQSREKLVCRLLLEKKNN